MRHYAFWPRLIVILHDTKRVNFKNQKKLCNPPKLSQLHIYLQVFHQKKLFITSNTPKNPGPFGPMPQCEQSSRSVGIICRKKSGGVRSRHFIKWLWASQTSENISFKTKVVPFENLILKSVNKSKTGKCFTKSWPF